MFQEIEEFVKTDPYTKAGLISSWYMSLSISQLPLCPFCDAQSKACLQKYVFSTISKASDCQVLSFASLQQSCWLPECKGFSAYVSASLQGLAAIQCSGGY